MSIDHIAIPTEWTLHRVEHHPGSSDGVRISDHDADVLDATVFCGSDRACGGL